MHSIIQYVCAQLVLQRTYLVVQLTYLVVQHTYLVVRSYLVPDSRLLDSRGSFWRSI